MAFFHHLYPIRSTAHFFVLASLGYYINLILEGNGFESVAVTACLLKVPLKAWAALSHLQHCPVVCFVSNVLTLYGELRISDRRPSWTLLAV